MNKKSWVILFATFIFLIVFIPCKRTYAGQVYQYMLDDVTSLQYDEVDDGYEILGLWCDYLDENNNVYEIDIPREFNSKPVVSIEHNTFFDLGFDDRLTITKIRIPDTVKHIDVYAGILRNDKVTSLVVDSRNPVYDSRNNCNAIIETASNTLIAGTKDTVIPDSVTCIGESAFRGCTGLTSITIPDSVTNIEEYAFAYCKSLENITITVSDSYINIGRDAFINCKNIKSVTVRSNLTSFGKKDSDLLEDLSKAFPNAEIIYCGSLFEYSNASTRFRIPDSVTSIGEGGFSFSTNSKEITIPESVTSIDDSVLPYIWQEDVLNIKKDSYADYYLFANNCLSNIRYYHDDIEINKTFMFLPIGYSDSLKLNGASGTVKWSTSNKKVATVSSKGKVTAKKAGTVVISAKNNGITYKCIITVVKCSKGLKFTKVNGGYELSGIGTCNDTEIVIPRKYKSKPVVSIGKEAFCQTGITNVTIPDTVTSIKEGAFYYSDLNYIIIPKSVNCIETDAFCGCHDLYYIEILGDIAAINSSTFGFCEGLKEIKIPDTVTSIGDGAFDNCYSLETVIFPDSLKSIGIGAFEYNYSLTNVDFPDGLESIGSRAFSQCGLTEVHIPKSVKSMDCSSFGHGRYSSNHINKITVAKGNKYYDSRDNCNAIIETKTNSLICGCKNTIIPDTVTSIGDYAFEYCSGLTSITIPNGVKSIGRYAFSDCIDLKEITILNGVTTIGDGAFRFCEGLTSISLPMTLTTIGEYALDSCTELTSLNIPKNVSSIGTGLFIDCPKLTSITVAKGNKKYDSRDNCNAVIETKTNTLIIGCANTVIPNSVKTIGEAAFIGCDTLKSITIPNGVKSIERMAFFDCEALKKITISNSVTSLKDNAFACCPSLKSIKIPDSVTYIANDVVNGEVDVYVKKGSYADKYFKTNKAAYPDITIKY